jgi:flavin-dependent dehydrogenase
MGKSVRRGSLSPQNDAAGATANNMPASDGNGGVGQLNRHNDVLVIGAGPSGIATAIAASQCGLRTTVLDARLPPIDKPCGEGLLPQGAAALRDLGIRLNSEIAFPLSGIRFSDEESSACSEFVGTNGYSLRRVRLHEILVEHAVRAGVNFHWGARVGEIHSTFVRAEKTRIPYTWLVGADGQNSMVRKWAGFSSRAATGKRFGFRKHLRIRPWTDVVEVYWGEGCQMVVTPSGTQEICVAAISRDPHLRVDQVLARFPALAERLRDATPTTRELGDVTSLMRLSAVTRDRVALVGDASGTVDALTGHGLSLAFQQALHLAEALKRGDLRPYEIAHRTISAMPAMMTRLMLIMDGNQWIRRRTLRLFQSKPELFSRLLSIHTGAVPVSSFGVTEMADFGWNFLWA